MHVDKETNRRRLLANYSYLTIFCVLFDTASLVFYFAGGHHDDEPINQFGWHGIILRFKIANPCTCIWSSKNNGARSGAVCDKLRMTVSDISS